MFGNNPPRKKEYTKDGQHLYVHSVFNTIQGEGPYAGQPATFIRLWGCHLACHFCDTDFESTKTTWSVSELLQRVRDNYAASLVVLTGGEPLRQNIAPLTHALYEAGWRVQVETAGSFYYPGIEAMIVVSPKTPTVHEELAREAHAWKYVISANMTLADDDGLPITNTQDREGAHRRLARPPRDIAPHRVYVQPMDEYDAERNAANVRRCVELSLAHGYTLSLQQHKIAGVE